MGEQQKVAAEVAEHEFERFVDAMDLDVDPAGMDADDKKSFEDAKRRIVGAMCEGRLSIDEQGRPVFKPMGGGEVTFNEPTGKTLIATDQKKKDHLVSKTIASLADMTGQPETRFRNMPNRDIKVCLAVYALFMGG